MPDTRSNGHYDEPTLRAYLDGVLDDGASDTILAHLAGCDRCGERLLALGAADADAFGREHSLSDALALLDAWTPQAHGAAYLSHIVVMVVESLGSGSGAAVTVPTEPESELLPLAWADEPETALTLEHAYAGPDELPAPPAPGLNAGHAPLRAIGQAILARLKGRGPSAGEAPGPSPGRVALVPLAEGEPAIDRLVEQPLVHELFTGDWIARFTNVVPGEYVLVFRPS